MIEMQRVSKLLMKLHEEGRTEFTDEEKAELMKARDDSIQALEDALK